MKFSPAGSFALCLVVFSLLHCPIALAAPASKKLSSASKKSASSGKIDISNALIDQHLSTFEAVLGTPKLVQGDTVPIDEDRPGNIVTDWTEQRFYKAPVPDITRIILNQEAKRDRQGSVWLNTATSSPYVNTVTVIYPQKGSIRTWQAALAEIGIPPQKVQNTGHHRAGNATLAGIPGVKDAEWVPVGGDIEGVEEAGGPVLHQPNVGPDAVYTLTLYLPPAQ